MIVSMIHSQYDTCMYMYFVLFRYVTQLGQSIDHALSVSLGSPSDEHHVFKISIVTGMYVIKRFKSFVH